MADALSNLDTTMALRENETTNVRVCHDGLFLVVLIIK